MVQGNVTDETGPRFWFLYYDNKILLRRDADGTFSAPAAAQSPAIIHGPQHDLGLLGGVPCLAAQAAMVPEGPEWAAVDIRASYTLVDPLLTPLIGRGFQLVHWEAHSRFCPHCGGVSQQDSPISKRCPDCGELLFPHIALAVLALVVRDDSALLVHANNFKGPYYSCIAGYVEPGETLEECVSREVMEETGISVTDIRYFGSQPWPFPSLLMAAFTARYKEGELVLQESELDAGAFFRRDALPELPPDFTLSRWLIDAWSKGELPE